MESATSDSKRLSRMIKDSVVLLCQNSLTFTAELHVQALLAISIDRSTIFAVQIDETMAKTGETVAGVSSGTSCAQGKVLPAQRAPAARRLALPAPSASSPAGGDSMAWPLRSPGAGQPARTRGPRFPVGRGRGVVRGTRGGAARGGAAPSRVIRTAVSSVRFPVSRPRMQAPRGAGRPPGVRLALPPAAGTPRPAGAMQRAPAAVRQILSARMRKPSPRLAIMPPPAQSSSPGGVRQRAVSPRLAGVAPRGAGRPRLAIMPSAQQQSSVARVQSPPGVKPSILPGHAGAARPVTSPQGVGRPRLAIMPSAQQSSRSDAQSPAGVRQQSPLMVLPRQAGSVQAAASPRGVGRARLVPMSSPQQAPVLRSPTQPRPDFAPPPSSARLALMPPPPQSAVQSPPAARPQVPTTSPMAKYQLQFVTRQQTPRQLLPAAAAKQGSGPGPGQQQQHAAQLSSPLSSAGSQLRAVVEQLSKQHGQPSPVKQPRLAGPVPASIRSPVRLALEASQRPVIAVNQSHSGNVHVFSGAATVAAGTPQSPRTPGRPTHDATAELSNLLLSPSGSAAMPGLMALTQQQRVAPTSAAGMAATAAAAPHQPAGRPASVPQSYSAKTLADMIAQSGNAAAAQRLGMPNLGVMVTQPGEVMAAAAAFLSSPRAPFSQPAASQQLTAVPLYASPRPAPSTVPPSPTQRTDPSGTPRHLRGVLPGDVMVPGSLYGNSQMMQLAEAPSKPLPVPPGSVTHLQQQVMAQFSPQRQPPPSPSQAYLMSSVFMDGVGRSPQRLPQEGPRTPVALQQQQQQHRARSSPQVSSLPQSQIPAAYLNQNQRPPVPSHAGSVAQRVQNHEQVPGDATMQQTVLSQSQAAALQQFVLRHREASSTFPPGHVTPNSQQVPTAQLTVGHPQLMQYRPNVTTPGQADPSSAQQRGHPSSAQQPQPAASSPVPRWHEAASSSTAGGDLRKDPMAILEIIKQKACEQLRQEKQPTDAARHGTVTPSVPRQTESGTTDHIESMLNDSRRKAAVTESRPSGPSALSSQTSATSRPTSDPSSASASNASISTISSATTVGEQSLASVASSPRFDTSLIKEKLLQLRKKVQKTESVELGRQKIITAQLQQLQGGDVAAGSGEETLTEVADDIELYLSDTDPNADAPAVVKSSPSSTSVSRRTEPGQWVALFSPTSCGCTTDSPPSCA